ncbi:hypothetical protein GCM10010505_42400 [Kitasatospora aburaviensis]
MAALREPAAPGRAAARPPARPGAHRLTGGDRDAAGTVTAEPGAGVIRITSVTEFPLSLSPPAPATGIPPTAGNHRLRISQAGKPLRPPPPLPPGVLRGL